MTTPDRPPLSPAAQAVLDAFDDAFSEQVSLLEESPISTRAMSFMAAAALRAAADQVVPVISARTAAAAGKRRARADLLAIAAELEGGTPAT